MTPDPAAQVAEQLVGNIVYHASFCHRNAKGREFDVDCERCKIYVEQLISYIQRQRLVLSMTTIREDAAGLLVELANKHGVMGNHDDDPDCRRKQIDCVATALRTARQQQAQVDARLAEYAYRGKPIMVHPVWIEVGSSIALTITRAAEEGT